MKPKAASYVILTIVSLSVLISWGVSMKRDMPWTPREAEIVDQCRDGRLFPLKGKDGFADKRPLPYWIICGSYRLLGDSYAAFRIPGLLLGLLTLFVVQRTVTQKRPGRGLFRDRSEKGLNVEPAVNGVLQEPNLPGAT